MTNFACVSPVKNQRNNMLEQLNHLAFGVILVLAIYLIFSYGMGGHLCPPPQEFIVM